MSLGRWRLTFGEDIVAHVPTSPVGRMWSPVLVDPMSRWQVQCLPDGTLEGEPIGVTPGLCALLERGEVDPTGEAYLAVPAEATLLIRPWASGDRYRPMGVGGSRKLQDAFVDRRISVERRRLLPVVALDDGAILWVPGLVPAECGRILRDSTIALKLTYHPRLTRSE